MHRFRKHFAIFVLMGLCFLVAEVIFRVIDYPVPSGVIDMSVMKPWAFVGYTSLWMWPVGGLCGYLIGLLNQPRLGLRLPYQLQVLAGALIITAIELAAGVVLNLWMGLQLWNYAGHPLNLWGQISVLASLLWVLMTPLGMWIDDGLRFWMSQEPKPVPLWRYYGDLFRFDRRPR